MATNGWGLEVVRGTGAGRVYPLAAPLCLLGNDLQGKPGIDLGSQEGTSPRRMAPQQAEIVQKPEGPAVRDLDSPGGTFVNRQRLLAGQWKALVPGDVIQLGGVQLKVVSATAPTPHPAKAPPKSASVSTAPLAAPFRLRSGAMCRTWDDFLTVSSQNWSALRDELTSGRLATFLSTQGRTDLLPSATTNGSADERLDAWLASLPATRPAAPDLELHPRVVRLRATGGGMTRSKVVVTNTGYRLLRSTVRVEPPSAGWLTVPVPFREGFVTAEETEIPLDVHVPEAVAAPLSAFVVVEGNAGSHRVEVRIEPVPKGEAFPEAAPNVASDQTVGPFAWFGALPAATRVPLAAVMGAAARGLLLAGDRLVSADPAERPSLVGGATLFAAIGAVAASRWAVRRKEPGTAPAAAFAGGFAGVLAAALAVALCRGAEPWATSPGPMGKLLAVVTWAAVGGTFAWLSRNVTNGADAPARGSRVTT